MKTFLRLLKNFIVLSIPLVIICIYTYLNPFGYMTVEYPMWEEEKDAVRGGIEDADILIIGDSRAKSGLIPGELPGEKEIYNIAIGGATSIEMYYALSQYLENHEAPETAVVIFAPVHLCAIDNWQQTLFFNYLTLPELLEAEKTAVLTKEEAVCYSGFPADLLSFRLRLPNKYMDALINARGNGNLAENRAKFEALRETRGYTAFGEEDGNDDLNYETHHQDFDLSPMLDEYYIRLLDLLRNKGIEVIIAQAPMNEASGKALSQDFRQGFTEYIEGIEERYPEYTVETEVPIYDNSFFGDNNHLNRKGAEKFSKEFSANYPDIWF